MGAVGELFIQLGFMGDTKGLKDFKNKVEGAAGGMKKAVAKGKELISNVAEVGKGVLRVARVIGGAINSFKNLAQSLINNNKEFINLARNSNISAGTFKKWGNLGKVMGVDNAAQELANLDEKLYNLKMTGEGWEGFAFAGINPTGLDAEGVMEKLRAKVANMDDASATFTLKKIGIDPKMLHLLRMSKEEFNNLNNSMKKYQLTTAQTEKLQKYNSQLEMSQIKLMNLKDAAILQLMPYIVGLADVVEVVAEKFANFLEFLNQDTAWSNLIKYTTIAGTILTSLISVASFLTPVVGFLSKGVSTLTIVFNGLAKAIRLVGIAMKFLQSNPMILAISAAILLLVALIGWIDKFRKKNKAEKEDGDVINSNLPMEIKKSKEEKDKEKEVEKERKKKEKEERDRQKQKEKAEKQAKKEQERKAKEAQKGKTAAVSVEKNKDGNVEVKENATNNATPSVQHINQHIDHSKHITKNYKQTYNVKNTIHTSEAAKKVVDDLTHLQQSMFAFAQ